MKFDIETYQIFLVTGAVVYGASIKNVSRYKLYDTAALWSCYCRGWCSDCTRAQNRLVLGLVVNFAYAAYLSVGCLIIGNSDYGVDFFWIILGFYGCIWVVRFFMGLCGEMHFLRAGIGSRLLKNMVCPGRGLLGITGKNI